MKHRQTGITAIGFVLAAILALGIVLAVLKLTPIYLEHMKIASILEDVKVNLDGQGSSIPEIRRAIEKRLDIETVNALKVSDFEISKSKTGGFVVRAAHEGKAEYVGNLSLVVNFDKSVEIRR